MSSVRSSTGLGSHVQVNAEVMEDSCLPCRLKERAGEKKSERLCGRQKSKKP